LGALESPVYGVVLQHECYILRIKEGVIDPDDFRLGMVQGGAKDQPPDPAKAINSDLRHCSFLLISSAGLIHERAAPLMFSP